MNTAAQPLSLLHSRPTATGDRPADRHLELRGRRRHGALGLELGAAAAWTPTDPHAAAL